MALEDVRIHLDNIEKILKEGATKQKDSPELRNAKEQFRAINRTIKQLEKKKVPVPEKMYDVRNSLIATIKKHSLPGEDLRDIYNRTLNIVVEMGRMCKRNPRKDLYLKAKEKKKEETGTDILTKVLVNVLEEMGGSGKQKLIFQRVEEALQGKLSKADMERPKGKTPRWQTNLRSTRKRLIAEGILTPESKKSKWTLSKVRG